MVQILNQEDLRENG